MKRITLSLGLLLGLTGCTLLVQIGSHRAPSPSTTATPAVVSSVVAPAVTPQTTAAPCGEYHPPLRSQIPPLPKFTQKELDDSDALSRRLGVYISELRDYILMREKLNDDAYASYVQSCNPVPAP